MERLTRRDSQGRAYFDNDGVLIRGGNGAFNQKKGMTAHYIHDRFVALDKVIDRLAAYEDTELEPEEIVSVQEEPWCVFYFNRRCNLDGDFCPEGPGCPQEMSPEDALRLLKLAQAEKDGRLVVLQEGATVRRLQEEYHQAKHMADERLPSPDYTTGRIAGFGAGVIHILDKILTREEAEAALKKREATE